MSHRDAPTKKEVNKSWQEGYSGFIDHVTGRLSFLEDAGYLEPRVDVSPPECTIVYRHPGEAANVAVMTEWAGKPEVRIVPKDAPRRAFGLNRAMEVIAPDLRDHAPPTEKAPFSNELLARWIDFYGDFLAQHTDRIIRPTADFLDAIEARRREAEG